jgi:hypothetical protein
VVPRATTFKSTSACNFVFFAYISRISFLPPTSGRETVKGRQTRH